MSTHQVKTMIAGEPTFEKKLDQILGELRMGGALKTLSPLEYITDRQRAWFKGVAVPHMVKHDQNGESFGWWDDEIKRQCKGLAFLKKDVYFMQSVGGQKIGIGRLTTKEVGKKNMSLFIEEILTVSMAKGWGIGAPDKDLRTKK